MRLRSLAAVGLLSLLSGCADEECTNTGAGHCAEPSAPVFSGLTAEVEVRRDEQGVVHIFGATDADVSYTSGYMQAFDRLFQMDLMRRQALGRRAEILGKWAAGDDALMRRLGIPNWGKTNAQTMLKEDPETYALLVAWTAGINARIDEVTSGAAPLPYGFGPAELNYMPEHWDVSDAFTVGKLILFGNANLIEYELLATILDDYVPVSKVIPVAQPLLPTYILPPDERPAAGSAAQLKGPVAAATLPPDGAQKLRELLNKMRNFRPAASNNWAIDGRFTDNGKPILAGDPHQGLKSPSLMWAHHINSKDKGGHLNVIGFSFVGTPSVELGHNDRVAWTATTNYPDTMDMWEVPSDGDSVVVGGTDITLVKRTEVVQVRDEDSQTLIVEEVPGYGVLLPVDISPLPVTKPGNRLLFGWAGFRPTHEAGAFQAFDLSSSLEDFEAAVDSMEIGNFNFVAATASGISYRSSPLIPDRKNPLNKPAYRVLDGSDPDTLWTDQFYGLDRLPHSRALNRGWIVSANNDPFGFTSDGVTTGDAFYFGVFFDPGTRAARIESEIARLAGLGPISPDQIKDLQMDSHSVLADFLVPLSQTAAAAVGSDATLSAYVGRGDLQELATRLGAWDRKMLRGSSDALVFEAYAHFLTKRSVGDDFGVAFDPISEEQPIYMMKLAALTLTAGYPGSEAFAQEGVNALVMAALDDTAAFLTTRFSGIHPSLYTWGDFHGTYFGSIWGDKLDAGWIPTDGGDGTVNVSTAPFFRGGNVVERLESGSGSIYRMVTHFDDDLTPSAEVNFPRGNSGDPNSPFYDNTVGDWAAGRYRKLHFRTDEVVLSTVEKLVLTP